ncbi:hypothetical protein COW57_04640 [Candidatus Roizmanbacteria bacterium CG17_big_fil_post_rev_8_21_14_2_50_39_7]|uniref:PGAP1 family protein n=1 Tax=Candidatus Roizmanbacteria bacterium CG17_big_fil_post_rev_8_21_14_2_50_39_7 TaxID=1974858 RepID=A0A2M7EJ22_9BACT|nr:MAG: hypothetical protein COW57_04640 [Candidatus Roizmanbacteria bacterium CG17_big_fil_post_rev_8_21_14_2_50_39_7]
MVPIILLSIFFFFVPPVFAQEFSLYQNNPVLKKDSMSAGVFQPFVSKNNSTFSLWFADSDGNKATIALMKSANGIDWYDKTTLQLSYRNSVHDPFMFINNNEYQLYFGSSNYGNISIWKSISQDGKTFQKGNEVEVLKPEYSWEGSNLSCPSVIEDKSLQYLFYAGSGNGWAIGMATSADGTGWQKCSNNPVIPAGSGPQIVKYNDLYYLFYQSPTGLQVQQTDNLNGCDTVWTNKHPIFPPFGDPAPVVVGNDLWLYGTFGTLEGQAIGLAGNAQIAQPTYPIVLIPGMFASWNKEALLHNTDVSFDMWKLHPAVTEYNAIEKTLENKGRTKNTDYFLFTYDWRAPLTTTIDNLNQFLEGTIWNTRPYQPIQLIGHSLGGVVTQLYAQKDEKKPIKNIITVGSPLLGALQSYKPLAGGEIDRENTLMWMAEKLVLLLNKSGIESDKDTIMRMLPIMKDILPTFPYLKNGSGSYITSSLNNTTLSNTQINSSISQFYLGGSGYQTNSGYVVGSRTPLDTLLSIYQDGHPISSWQEEGDGIIPLKSTLNQITPAPIQNHGELIYSKTSIKTILSKLNIQVQDSDIPVGQATSIFPAILTFIQSPATIQISRNGVTVEEDEGMIWIQNAENGTYNLNVTGTGEGEYTVSIWLIGENDDKWIQLKKQTSSGKIDEYTISFDSSTGGTAVEYIAPSPTPTLTPSPTPTVISQSSSSNSNSAQPTNSESKKENTESTKPNTNFAQGISDVVKKVARVFENKKTQVSKKETVPQILGVANSKKITYRSPLSLLFFIKQILWGVSTVFITLFYEVKKIKNGLPT